MAAIFALVVASIAYLGQVHVTVVDDVGEYVRVGMGAEYPAGSYYGGWTYCGGDRPDGTIVIKRGAFQWTHPWFAHEVMHAVDCRDDGQLNGSPEPGGCLTLPRDCSHSWVNWALGHPTEAAGVIRDLS